MFPNIETGGIYSHHGASVRVKGKHYITKADWVPEI
jgi:hypothetical protein